MRCSPLDRLGFTMDKSCRLYVPFYRYNFSTNGKVQDLSPYGNHGTIVGGPGPWPVPIPDGEELVNNPYFTQGNPPTGWSTANGMESWVGDGTKGTWTDNPASGAYIYQGIPTLAAGERYVLRIVSAYSVGELWDYAIAADPDIIWGHNLSSQELCVVKVVTGNGSACEARCGNPSSVDQLGKNMYMFSVQPLVGYEARGWAFDGVDDYVSFPSLEAMNCLSQLTMLMWLKYVIPSPSNDNFLGAHYPGFVMYSSERRYHILYYNNGSTYDLGCYYTFDMWDRWICLAITYRTGDAMRIYRNGILRAYNSNANSPLISSGNFRVGKVDYPCTPYFRFGELAVFSRAMSADEIMNYYLQTRHRYN